MGLLGSSAWGGMWGSGTAKKSKWPHSHHWQVVLAAGWVFSWAYWLKPHFPFKCASLQDCSGFFIAWQLGSTRSVPWSKYGSFKALNTKPPRLQGITLAAFYWSKQVPGPNSKERGKRLPFDVGVARLYWKGTCGMREIAVATYPQMKFLDNII